MNSYDSAMDAVYREGRTAAISGLGRDANPYCGDAFRERWLDGWHDAKESPVGQHSTIEVVAYALAAAAAVLLLVVRF